jgi:uncharacterized protein (DUF736 family)
MLNMDVVWAMGKPIVAGQIRTIVASAGGALVAVGAVSTSEESSFITISTGIIMWAIPAAWSAWDKYGKAFLLAKLAKSQPIVTPSATTAEAVTAALKQ